MDTILPAQWGWEVLRNLISALHQWVYYFLPCLTYPESGYSAALLQEEAHDFVRAMLVGFFSDSDDKIIENTTRNIWRFLDVVLKGQDQHSRIGLRQGEYVLQQHYIRPVFYFAMLVLLSGLIQGSELQKSFPLSDTTPDGLRHYVEMSCQHSSHAHLFPGYSSLKLQNLIEELFGAV
jgi:hypothetical protein